MGLRPARVFDTELAARLAGFERVGLASVVEQLLGYTLEKGFSAADWSTRPLPQDWLRYAALDVELLIELRELLRAELERQGKLGWAEQEFAAAVKRRAEAAAGRSVAAHQRHSPGTQPSPAGRGARALVRPRRPGPRP